MPRMKLPRMKLPFDQRAAHMARERVRGLHLVDESQLQILELLVSEVVTNAVRHGSPPVTLAVTATRDGVRIEVDDGSTREPHHIEPSPDGGFGLPLLDAFSEAWGTNPTAAGKAVWFELEAHGHD